MKKKTGRKLISTLMVGALLVCVFLLCSTIIKCSIPKFDYSGNKVTYEWNPGGRKTVMDFDFNGVAYKNMLKGVPTKDIENNIGEANKGQGVYGYFEAFKIKGVDMDRAIGVQVLKDSDTYYLAYNYGYWKKKLPEIVVFSLLILVSSVGMVMICKRGFRFHKIGSTDD